MKQGGELIRPLLLETAPFSLAQWIIIFMPLMQRVEKTYGHLHAKQAFILRRLYMANMFSLVLMMFLKVYKRLKQILVLNQYDDFTIAEYFRRQGAKIGEDNRIEVRSLGTEPYLIKIGNHCTIAPGVKFITHDGATWLFTEEVPSFQKFGAIRIYDNCFIGIDSIIMGDVNIGPNSVVGACSSALKRLKQNIPFLVSTNFSSFTIRNSFSCKKIAREH